MNSLARLLNGCPRALYNQAKASSSSVKDPSEFFFNKDVQLKLKKLTGRDYDRILRPKKLGQKLKAPKYEFMTQAQLQQALVTSEKKAEEKLQMPPLMGERKPITEVLCEDPELQGLDQVNYVFSDISLGVPERKRSIVVRDAKGTLRKATWEERERLLQIYFPRPGREMQPPPMFEEANLTRLLDEYRYIFILDRACAQYEPDDREYIRVTRATYAQIDKREDFEVLWSTRHYGPMILYLTLEKRIDRLLKHLIVNEKIDDVADLVQLYNFVHHGSSLTEAVEDPIELLKTYLERDALKRHILELALQSYQELIQQRKQQHGSRVSQ